MLYNLCVAKCCKVLSVVGVDRSRRLFHRFRGSAKQAARHQQPTQRSRSSSSDGFALFFRIGSHLFFAGVSPASCVRPEHRCLSSGVAGRRDDVGGRVGRLGWRLGWGWGKGSAPWLGACQQELGWGMLGRRWRGWCAHMTGETEVGGRPSLLVGRPRPAFNRHLGDPHNPTSPPIQPVEPPPNSRPATKLNSTQP